MRSGAAPSSESSFDSDYEVRWRSDSISALPVSSVMVSWVSWWEGMSLDDLLRRGC